MTTPLDPADVPASARWSFLNHAGVAPLPRPVSQAMCDWATGTGSMGSVDVEAQQERMEQVRELGARTMGVGVDEVAFVKNTTEGLGFVANGLGLEEGDRIVVPDAEFPSTLFPWIALEARGVVVDRVPPRGDAGALPVEAFSEVIARGVPPKVVVTSWVQFSRGWRTDLAGLAAAAHAAGALLCVDAIQGLGVIPAAFDEWGVDFAAADAHKWLLGPPGIGLLYVRRSCLDLLRPLEPGWASVVHREQWDNLDLVYDASARKLEGGSPNACGIYGLGAALEFLLAAGVEAVWAHVSDLCNLAHEALSAAGYAVLSDRSAGGRSGILTFALGGERDPTTVARLLETRGVICSPRGGGIRLSPHGYNQHADVDRLVAALDGD